MGGGQIRRLSRSRPITVVGIAIVVIALVAVGRLTSGSLRAVGPPATTPADRPAAASPVVARIALPRRVQLSPWDGVSAVAVGPDAVWAARCEVFRVDPRSNQVLATVAGTGQSAATCVRSVTAGAGMVWGVVPGVGLVRIDPATNRVAEDLQGGGRVVVDRGAVWVAASAGGVLLRVDPHTSRVVERLVRACGS